MYIDPNAGGLLFSTLTCVLCGFSAVLLIGGGTALVFFLNRNKNDRDSAS
ncbi:MAG: hypothetical protein HY869_10940 [Chloroflexi bacterium]|nr:hypothetical protein [Chloroflexota bacterium]